MHTNKRSGNEKKFKDTHKHCWKKTPRFPQQNGNKVRTPASSASTEQRQKEALHLKLRNPALLLIEIYQRQIRPLLPDSCRFEPSCSEFTKQAILKYGFIKGVFKGLTRILRCHPFSKQSGYDPLV